nr:MAG: capsid protein [Cressdnaviricota sp.]
MPYYKRRSAYPTRRRTYSRSSNLTGHGDYRSTFNKYASKIPKGTFSRIGNFIGGRYGGSDGAYVGRYLGRQAANLVGHGDYTVKGSGFIKSMTTSDRSTTRQNMVPNFTNPKIKNLANGEIQITHKEYIGDVISGAANSYNSTSYALNPGLITTFPWLSQIANMFSEYTFTALAFEYRTMSCDALNSTNTALGQVIMSTQYDATQGAYPNKIQQENSEFAVSVKPSKSALMAVECKRSRNVLATQYTRFSTQPTGSDIRMYDLGIMQVATNNLQAAYVNVGEMWVTYSCILRKPNIISNVQNYQCSHYYFAGSSAALPFTASPTAAINNLMPITFAALASSTGQTITFPTYINEGNYLICCSWEGASILSSYAPTVAQVQTNCTLLTNFWGSNTSDDAAYSVITPANGSANITRMSFMCVVSINAPGGLQATVSFGNTSTALPTLNFGDLVITPISSLLTN